MTEAFFSMLPKPRPPMFDDVHRSAIQLGGTKEQAEAFYNKWDAVGWYKVNPTQPITNYIPLLASFINTWRQNESQRGKSRNDWGGF